MPVMETWVDCCEQSATLRFHDQKNKQPSVGSVDLRSCSRDPGDPEAVVMYCTLHAKYTLTMSVYHDKDCWSLTGVVWSTMTATKLQV